MPTADRSFAGRAFGALDTVSFCVAAVYPSASLFFVNIRAHAQCPEGDGVGESQVVSWYPWQRCGHAVTVATTRDNSPIVRVGVQAGQSGQS